MMARSEVVSNNNITVHYICPQSLIWVQTQGNGFASWHVQHHVCMSECRDSGEQHRFCHRAICSLLSDTALAAEVQQTAGCHATKPSKLSGKTRYNTPLPISPVGTSSPRLGMTLVVACLMHALPG